MRATYKKPKVSKGPHIRITGLEELQNRIKTQMLNRKNWSDNLEDNMDDIIIKKAQSLIEEVTSNGFPNVTGTMKKRFVARAEDKFEYYIGVDENIAPTSIAPYSYWKRGRFYAKYWEYAQYRDVDNVFKLQYIIEKIVEEVEDQLKKQWRKQFNK